MLQGLTKDVINRRSRPAAIECHRTPQLFPPIVVRLPRCISTTVTLAQRTLRPSLVP
jgi:hypothetical protein